MKRGTLIILLLCTLMFAGCATAKHKSVKADDETGKGLGPQKYADETTTYITGSLPLGWRRLWGYDADLAYFNPALQATIMANSTCGIKKTIPLQALTNHLLLDLKERHIVNQLDLDIDMRKALMTIVQGRLDGALVKMEIVVVQVDTCVYDFAYIVGLEKYEAGKEDFRKFVHAFHARRRG